ncbi:MAG: hypothetical protein KGI35_20015, partial [Burkholderiales bacterium]|nr:hypothetical protein [Burkholderiales bacterium]
MTLEKPFFIRVGRYRPQRNGADGVPQSPRWAAVYSTQAATSGAAEGAAGRIGRTMPRPIEALIHLPALAHNLARAR